MNTHAGRKLSRPTGARFGLLRNLATSLLRHEQIQTTLAKAREAARTTETLLALAKRKDLVSVRKVSAMIPDRTLRQKIYNVLAPRYQARSGGCTRIHRLGRRLSDGSEMAVIKLIP